MELKQGFLERGRTQKIEDEGDRSRRGSHMRANVRQKELIIFMQEKQTD